MLELFAEPEQEGPCISVASFIKMPRHFDQMKNLCRWKISDTRVEWILS